MPRSIPENEDDFIRMQQEAIRRVREMQERARRTLESAGMPIAPPSPDPAEAPPPEPVAPPVADAPADDPPGPPFSEPRREHPNAHASAHPHSGTPGLPIPGLSELLPALNISLDTEQILLLVLIFLLYQDGSDRYLTLALAYIMLF